PTGGDLIRARPSSARARLVADNRLPALAVVSRTAGRAAPPSVALRTNPAVVLGSRTAVAAAPGGTGIRVVGRPLDIAGRAAFAVRPVLAVAVGQRVTRDMRLRGDLGR